MLNRENQNDGLALNDGKSCVAKPNSAVRMVYESAYLVSRNMSLVLGKCSNISVGSPVNKNGRLFDGDKPEHLTLLLEFFFDGYIIVDKITVDFVNE